VLPKDTRNRFTPLKVKPLGFPFQYNPVVCA
jgi:hypothetical protein